MIYCAITHKVMRVTITEAKVNTYKPKTGDSETL